jgi:Flp pilus assembly protein TadB
MAGDEPRPLRGWNRSLHSAWRHPGLYRGLTAFFAVAVVGGVAVIVSNVVAGKWGRVAWGAVVLAAAAVLFRLYLALVRQEPRPPSLVFGLRSKGARRRT